ncbi:DUF202 domain-containing protein [Agreia sp. VKM Ac-1783]|jgi:putative membrane protein|uniref:YidH family protein n=1 Tax=Agreia sp. VKM Ac-1783 TaxID=1938889 RepID=UPI000A2ADF1A|nr:DUF202 domain-containing protein [Agreia sp. VKM Ac-1783]SMQ75444.1 putative membrane protein [Agreia sp. VKM Ac-1783]
MAPDKSFEDNRRPRSVYGVGDEPDARFSLANERTALAWMRTGLALVAGGVALTTLAGVADLPLFVDVMAALVCLGGGLVAVSALIGWRRVERAMRLALPLPAPRILVGVGLGIVVLALVFAGYAVFEALQR